MSLFELSEGTEQQIAVYNRALATIIKMGEQNTTPKAIAPWLRPEFIKEWRNGVKR